MGGLLSNHQGISYGAMFEFWLDMLDKFKIRLAGTVRAKGDYEKGPRKEVVLALVAHGYEVQLEGEWFHYCKSIWKRIGLFHLRGLYMFTNQGDPEYFNPFRFCMQMIFCLPLLPSFAVKKTYLLLKPSLMIIHGDPAFDYSVLTLNKSGCKKYLGQLIVYFDTTWVGDETHPAKYTIHECNNYDQPIRTTNVIETWHNVLRSKVGIKSDIFDFLSGMQELENETVLQFMQYLDWGFSHRRRKEYVEREKELQKIWNKCKLKIDSVEDKNEIEATWWFDILVEIQCLMYSHKNNIIAGLDCVVDSTV